MKSLKNNLFILMLIVPATLAAQSETTTFKNEFGTDIIGLVQEILDFNNPQFNVPYAPIYQITYKRHFEKMSLRVGVGGNISADEVANNAINEIIKNSRSLLNYRIGVEKPINLSKRWNFYYGIDFKQGISNDRADFNYQNGGWRIGSDSKSSTFGVSPLFGIEFRITDRIALQTEANFMAYYLKTTNQPLITQISDTPSFPKPSTDLETTKGNGMEFNVPNFLVLTIKI
jgi:hypothetical protein